MMNWQCRSWIRRAKACPQNAMLSRSYPMCSTSQLERVHESLGERMHRTACHDRAPSWPWPTPLNDRLKVGHHAPRRVTVASSLTARAMTTYLYPNTMTMA
jgi:hypothetical protein